MHSLNVRVLLAASAVLASFFGLAGVTLDRVYTQNARAALNDRLRGEVHALIAAAALDDQGRLYMPEILPETRFSIVLPDFYAQITIGGRSLVWRSSSLSNLDVYFATGLARNEQRFDQVTLPNGRSFATYSLGVAWDDITDMHTYTFSAAEDLEGTRSQARHFRENLWGWLGGVALILLGVQWMILRWGLGPLKIVAHELRAIEAGKQTRLEYQYPSEMQGLTDNVNALLNHQHEHLNRYRHTLGDLAHSLKTPLAVLQNALDSVANESQTNPAMIKAFQEQLHRINQITEYQLQRAATAGQSPLKAPVSVGLITEKVLNSLHKVYAEKQVRSKTDIDKSVLFHGDESDLMEVIGNLADNAFKWCRGRVVISASNACDDNQVAMVSIRVDDDGPGIPLEMIHQVVQRGVRADQGISGHGIGLSVVQDIVQIYGGKLDISASPEGGASILISLPDVV